MRIEFLPGTGELMMNNLRQMSRIGVRCWRPIAICVVGSSNVLEAGDNIQEDVIELISRINRMAYLIDDDSDLFIMKKNFNGCVMSDDLSDGHVQCVGDSFELMHCSSSVIFQIIFRNACGGKRREENREFLDKHGLLNDQLVIFNSMHSDLVSFKFKKVECPEKQDKEVYDVCVETRVGDERGIINSAFNAIKNACEGVFIC